MAAHCQLHLAFGHFDAEKMPMDGSRDLKLWNLACDMMIAKFLADIMPPIPWDVELARWFEERFPDLDRRRTYARPSRRQGATPDIPRPRYVERDAFGEGRTFGVVVDTSGSMSPELLGMALGSITSYGAAREVPLVRVIFCDARAYDAGHLAPEEIAGRVQVKGRGGDDSAAGNQSFGAGKRLSE